MKIAVFTVVYLTGHAQATRLAASKHNLQQIDGLAQTETSQMDYVGMIKALKPSNLDKGPNTQSAPSINIVDNNKSLTAPGCPMGMDMNNMQANGMGIPGMGAPMQMPIMMGSGG